MEEDIEIVRRILEEQFDIPSKGTSDGEVRRMWLDVFREIALTTPIWDAYFGDL